MRITSKLRDYYVEFHEKIELAIQSASKSENPLWIIDANVHNFYPQLRNIPNSFLLVCNEETKSFEYIDTIIDKFAGYKVRPISTVIVVGGGTLQDAASFVCSIYNRGIKWKFIPTTLLSMADSCIGGKTSINYRDRKNIMGTYFPPTEVLICSKFLDTLPKEYYNSGMGEIVKFHALCGGKVLDKNKTVDKLIEWSLTYKRYIVETDEFDENYRKILNYGHTFGHALESISNYQIVHGRGVMMGMLIVNRYARKLGLLTQEKEQEIQEMIRPFISFYKDYNPDWFDYNKLMEIIKSDKKNTTTVNLIILENNSPTLHSVSNFVYLQESLEEIKEWLEYT